MYSFKNDYSEGAHPRILDALCRTNLRQEEGYGEDWYTLEAIKLLKKQIRRTDIDIHFFSGGTQTNLTAVSAFLRPHEAVISADTGHINVHETGAIEATGHKLLTVPSDDGKIRAKEIQSIIDSHKDEHMVKPRLVYISNATEIGTVYTQDELEQVNLFCRANQLILYMDGARLGSALCAYGNDLDFYTLSELVDSFYIGGTKNGALLGEALVICRDNLKEDFRFQIKQKGALLAKGRLLGIQFVELFKDGLFFDLANHANRMSNLLKEAISEMGFDFLTSSPTNQIFPILPNWLIADLEKKYGFYVWWNIDPETSAIRLVTSWATREEAIQALIYDVKKALT